MSGAQFREMSWAPGIWVCVTCFELLTPEAFGMCLWDMQVSDFTSLHSTEIPQGGRGGIQELTLQTPGKAGTEGPRGSTEQQGQCSGWRCSRGDNIPTGKAIPGNHQTIPSASLWLHQLSLWFKFTSQNHLSKPENVASCLAHAWKMPGSLQMPRNEQADNKPQKSGPFQLMGWGSSLLQPALTHSICITLLQQQPGWVRRRELAL